MLAGGLLGCVSLALMMANAGGAWDNAKKFVERVTLVAKALKRTQQLLLVILLVIHLKTSGLSMNILINVMAIVSLVIAPLKHLIFLYNNDPEILLWIMCKIN